MRVNNFDPMMKRERKLPSDNPKEETKESSRMKQKEGLRDNERAVSRSLTPNFPFSKKVK